MKKLLARILCAAMTIGLLASCGSNSNPGGASNQPSSGGGSDPVSSGSGYKDTVIIGVSQTG
mgnify:CR=1 FL=1